jgi:hypothetical protein
VFVQTLHLPVIRLALHNSRTAMERIFGVALIALGARVAVMK